jgi:hypothetical protein
MLPRETYICQSKVCRREIEIEILPRQRAGEISNPRCTCGSEMKKHYDTPRFKVYGDILTLTKGSGMTGITLDGGHVLKT